MSFQAVVWRLLISCVLAAVVQPAYGQYRVVWGDVHGHTSRSDGKGTLDDYFAYARDVAKLDFVIVTDHDFGNGPPWRLPKEAWQLTQEEADAYTVDGRFVAIAGYEWTSQPKYWIDVEEGQASERLFPGTPKYYNHKNVYFPGRVDYLFSAKNPAYMTPDLLAAAVGRAGGLIHNNHLASGDEGRDQWDYTTDASSVIVNTEMYGNTLQYEGKRYQVDTEKTVCGFLDRGGKTGFIRGTDTHEGQTAARTAVFTKELTREAIFEALRHRRNYAISHARIVLDFRVNGHPMGEEIEIERKPRLTVELQGTDTIRLVEVLRNGSIVHSVEPKTEVARVHFVDEGFRVAGYYYVRVTQVDTDEHGNPSQAWSSPIWVRAKR